MNATPYAGTPEHLRTAGNVIVETSAASAEAPSKSAGPSGSLGVVGGCLEVSSAEALLLRWHLEAEQMDKHAKHWGETNEPTIAGLCKGTSDGIRKCLQDLRREMGLPYPRQPQDNISAQTRSGESPSV